MCFITIQKQPAVSWRGNTLCKRVISGCVFRLIQRCVWSVCYRLLQWIFEMSQLMCDYREVFQRRCLSWNEGLPQREERPFFFSLFFFCCKFCAQKKIALASFYQHFCLLRMCQMQDLVSHLSECLALSLSSYFSSSYYQPFWSCYSFCQSFSYFFFLSETLSFRCGGTLAACVKLWSCFFRTNRFRKQKKRRAEGFSSEACCLYILNEDGNIITLNTKCVVLRGRRGQTE